MNHPEHGVTDDKIVVALMGMGPGDFTSMPTDPRGADDYRVLRAYFQGHFQTCGRTVVLCGYNSDGYQKGTLSGAALIQDVKDTCGMPFAALPGTFNRGWATPWTGTDETNVRAFAAAGIFYFAPDLTPNLFSPHLTDSFLDTPTDKGGVAPYVWSFLPSIQDVQRNSASWLCWSVLKAAPKTGGGYSYGGTVTESTTVTPNYVGKPRKVALAYSPNRYAEDQQGDLRALSIDLQSAVTSMCGDTQLDTHGPYAIYPPGDTAGISTVAASLNSMYQNGDTSVVCLYCWYYNDFSYKDSGDLFAEAETNAVNSNHGEGYLELMFISGSQADPYRTINNMKVYNNAVGLSDLWQLPGYAHTYWHQAYQSTYPASTVSFEYGMQTYEKLLLLFSAIQLAGPDPSAANVVAGLTGRGPTGTVWRRGFWADPSVASSPYAPDPASPPVSPSAGFTPGHHAFLKGMQEVRWDNSPGSVPPEGWYPLDISGGCYRAIDAANRFDVGWPGTTPWLHRDDSTQPGPCEGDYQGYGGNA